MIDTAKEIIKRYKKGERVDQLAETFSMEKQEVYMLISNARKLVEIPYRRIPKK